MPTSTPRSSILRDAAIKPATLSAYDKQLTNFLTHTRLSLPQLLSLSPVHIDRLLSGFIDHSHSIGGSYEYNSQALFGLIYRQPSLRSHLGESRLRLRGWGTLKVSRSHPPITWELTVLFAVTLASWSHHAEAVAMLLAFDCYLRVGELTRLRFADIVMPDDPRLGSAHRSMALRLATTKTGLNQWVSLQNTAIATVLRDYIVGRSLAHTDLVFSFTPARLRALMHSVAVALGLGDTPYVPHSLRHGGATYDFLRGATVEQIMFHGRWKSMESARRYIQSGRAILTTVSVSSDLNDAGAAFIADLVAVMQHLRLTRPSTSTRSARRVRFAPTLRK